MRESLPVTYYSLGIPNGRSARKVEATRRGITLRRPDSTSERLCLFRGVLNHIGGAKSMRRRNRAVRQNAPRRRISRQLRCGPLSAIGAGYAHVPAGPASRRLNGALFVSTYPARFGLLTTSGAQRTKGA